MDLISQIGQSLLQVIKKSDSSDTLVQKKLILLVHCNELFCALEHVIRDLVVPITLGVHTPRRGSG